MIATNETGGQAAPLAPADADELTRLEAIVAANLEGFRRAGEALAEIKERELYPDATWEAYLDRQWGISKRHAYRLIEGAAIAERVTHGSLPSPETERATRALSAVPEDQQSEVWAEAVARNGGEAASGKQVEEVYAERLASAADDEDAAARLLLDSMGPSKTRATQAREAMTSSESNGEKPDAYAGDEFYTPDTYAFSVREVLGPPELDPASCIQANRRIGAIRYFTKEMDALILDWMARTVFLNPPYRRGLIERFVEKLLMHYQAGEVGEAILLVNANTSSKWFKPLWGYTLCFVDKRIRFDGPAVDESGALVEADDADPAASEHGARAASVFVYMGPHPEKFARVFAKHGEIVTRWRPTEVKE